MACQVSSSRGHGLNNAECIGKWTIFTLAMPNDRNTLTPNNLPVLVCGVIYDNKSKRYGYGFVLVGKCHTTALKY